MRAARLAGSTSSTRSRRVRSSDTTPAWPSPAHSTPPTTEAAAAVGDDGHVGVGRPVEHRDDVGLVAGEGHQVRRGVEPAGEGADDVAVRLPIGVTGPLGRVVGEHRREGRRHRDPGPGGRRRRPPGTGAARPPGPAGALRRRGTRRRRGPRPPSPIPTTIGCGRASAASWSSMLPPLRRAGST